MRKRFFIQDVHLRTNRDLVSVTDSIFSAKSITQLGQGTPIA